MIALGKLRGVLVASLLAVLCPHVFGLDPSLSISQYAHTAWTSRDGFSVGNIFSMAQTFDGYFWLGGEFGLFRFDGVSAVSWQPPAGQALPEKFAFQLAAARDDTLWIGTFSGLASWDGAKLTRHPEFAEICAIALRRPRGNGLGGHSRRGRFLRPSLRDAE